MKELDRDFDFSKEKRYDVYPEDCSFVHFTIGDGGGTVCGVRKGGKLYYAISLCSPLDNFCRYDGREIALFNMVKEESHMRGVLNVSNSIDEPPPVLLARAVNKHISAMRHKPRWLRKNLSTDSVKLRGKRKIRG